MKGNRLLLKKYCVVCDSFLHLAVGLPEGDKGVPCDIFPPFLIKTCVVNEAGLSGVLLLLDAGGVGRVASASPNELLEFILCRRYEDIGYVGVDE